MKLVTVPGLDSGFGLIVGLALVLVRCHGADLVFSCETPKYIKRAIAVSPADFNSEALLRVARQPISRITWVRVGQMWTSRVGHID